MSTPDLPPDPVLVIVSRGKPIAASSDPRAPVLSDSSAHRWYTGAGADGFCV